MLPGEVGFVTLGAEGATDAAAVGDDPQSPWYSSLWGALQEADDNADSADK